MTVPLSNNVLFSFDDRDTELESPELSEKFYS